MKTLKEKLNDRKEKFFEKLDAECEKVKRDIDILIEFYKQWIK